jgi:hypothetical protein
MVDPILYAIASIFSAITTTILSRVHAIVNPQAVSQGLLGQCQTADCNESGGQQSTGSAPDVGHNITSTIVIVVVITNPLTLISSYTIADFFLLAIAFVLANTPLFLAAISFILSLVRSAALLPSVLTIIRVCIYAGLGHHQ